MNSTVEDLTSLEWRDTNWIERVGGFRNEQMVLDYFAMSPFWDRQSNNQILLMQTQFNNMRPSYEDTLRTLEKMEGIEFAIIYQNPPVWVIAKRYRKADYVRTIATYYVAGANVYQSPTIYSVIANRLLTSVFHVNSAFKEAQDLVDFHPAKGYSWKSDTPPGESTGATPSEGTPQASQLSQPQASILRAQDHANLRQWMARAIDASAERTILMRQSALSDASNQDASQSRPSQQREDVGGKRTRRKTEDGPSTTGKQKKRTNK